MTKISATIERAIILHEGNCLSGFPSVDVFPFLTNPELEKIRESSIRCPGVVDTANKRKCADNFMGSGGKDKIACGRDHRE